MRFISFLAFLGIGAAGISGWYKFHNLKPKTLKEYLEWQGLNLISNSNDNYWKAVLSDSNDVAKKVTDKESPTTEDIKNWCSDNLSKEDYDDLKSYAIALCVDNPKTVKARIIQLDGNTEALIGNNEDDKYKVSYVFRKHISGFNALIGYSPSVDEEGNEVEDLNVAKEAFKNWCVNSLEKAVDETLVLNVRTLCTPKKFSSIDELITQKKEDSLLLTDSINSSDLESKYNDIKLLDSWVKDESRKSSKATSEDLKIWCNEHHKKKFSEDGVFSEVYPKFRFRCLKTKGKD